MTTTPPMSPEKPSIPDKQSIPGKPSISDAMAKLWAKFLPEIERRVDVLDAAAAALLTGALTTEKRESAHADAHKLAGLLGTFGLHRGTEIARQAELALATDPVATTAQQLGDWVAEIRGLIHQRQ